ncbi:MAG: hypothetical protein M1150_04365 [Patescibacteria group bacterium]|nr:hypothetical protein [Patescibacteria group bacterium]
MSTSQTTPWGHIVNWVLVTFVSMVVLGVLLVVVNWIFGALTLGLTAAIAVVFGSQLACLGFPKAIRSNSDNLWENIVGNWVVFTVVTVVVSGVFLIIANWILGLLRYDQTAAVAVLITSQVALLGLSRLYPEK